MPRSVLALALFALAVLVGYFGAVRQWEEISVVREEIARLQAISEELTALAEERDRLLAAYNAIPEADLANLRLMIPASPDTARVLVNFETFARESNVVLERVDFMQQTSAAALAPAGGERASAIPIVIGIRGRYEGFQSFLSALERNLRLTDVANVNFSAGETQALSVSLQGRIYYRP